MKSMNEQWQPGDDIGRGVTYLHDNESRAAYGSEVRRQIVEAFAVYVASGNSLNVRRDRIKLCPECISSSVKDRVRSIWENIRR